MTAQAELFPLPQMDLFAAPLPTRAGRAANPVAPCEPAANPRDLLDQMAALERLLQLYRHDRDLERRYDPTVERYHALLRRYRTLTGDHDGG